MTKPAFKYLAPATIRAPFAAYSHGVYVPPGHGLVFCSGQLGIAPDDTIPPDAADQAELCFRNIEAILNEAGMTLGNVIRINAFITDRAYFAPYMSVRDRLFPLPAPASTLVIVSGFTRPEFKVEVEVVAAAPLNDI